MTIRDKLYIDPLPEIKPFAFDESVARVFQDMIRRSVPGYATVIAISGLVAAQHARAGTNIYDLGCSLGATLLVIYRHISEDCSLTGVDNSEAMIAACKKNLALEGAVDITLICDDILNQKIDNASVVTMNFTLQFIEHELRLPLLQKIHRGLIPGGALLLSEKIRVRGHTERYFQTLHESFKRANGYSQLEISQKRSALEDVLIPEELQTHINRLEQAGYSNIIPWFQCLNFASLVAIA